MIKETYAIFRNRTNVEKIKITDEEREKIESAVSTGEEVFVGNKFFKISNFVKFEEVDTETTFEKGMREYTKDINLRLSWDSEKRADETKSHFGFWFWCVFNKNPEEGTWEKVKPLIKEFYENNNSLPFPPFMLYYKIIPSSKEKKVSEFRLSVIERIEANNLSLAKAIPSFDFLEKYTKKREKQPVDK